MDASVVPFDLVRMFFGHEPTLYYLEIAVRCVIVYLYTLFILRWIGGRSVAQLSLVEFLLIIALGSAVGDGVFYPDVPLLQALAVVTVVALINKGLDVLIIRYRAIKAVVDGQPIEVVTHGRIRSETIRRREMGPAEMQSLLRLAGIRNLGEVEHAFFEPGGSLSVFRYDAPRPGLRIMPPVELVPHSSVDAGHSTGMLACMTCGQVVTAPHHGNCPECARDHWTTAIGQVQPVEGPKNG